jgi:positive regulator of sigma E activity
MISSGTYIAIAIVVLFVVAILAFILGRREPHSRLTPLTGLAFAFVLAGILFGQDRLLGYGLMGVGVILAVIDIFRRPK